MSDDRSTPPRERILHAAARLLGEHGREGVSTRAVSAAAGVQAQTIYRQFGDMAGLLNAVARHGFAMYLGEKTASAGGPTGAQPSDPVESLRAGWDAHIEFALRNPAMYALMYGEPRPGMETATGDIRAALTAVLERIAVAGRLAVALERATEIVLAVNVGTALALLDARSRARPLGDDFSGTMREMVVATITTETGQARTPADDAAPGSPLVRSAVALTAGLPMVEDRFSPGEYTLLRELLGRLS